MNLSSLKPYVDELIAQREVYKSQNTSDSAVNPNAIHDTSLIMSNAKAEQILDDLFILYNCVKENKNSLSEQLKSYLKKTQYSFMIN